MLHKPSPLKKRAVVLLWLVSFFTLIGLVVHVLYPYIDTSLILNIFPFLRHSSTQSIFYGENADMSQILPSSQHYIINSKGQDLIDIAARLGINIIRITNGESSFNINEDSIYTRAQWNQVLNKMQSKGIKAIIVIEVASGNSNYYKPEIQPIYLHLVQEYMDSGVFSNPDVYAVDIKNEPLLTPANINMLQAAHAMLKATYPHLKETIGYWATPRSPKNLYNPDNYNWADFSGGQIIDNMVDFYSIHMYGLETSNFGIDVSPDLKTKLFISEVEAGLQTKKPILIEEFGEANGDAVSDQGTIGNPQLQASVYKGVYQALKEMHSDQIIGAVAFDFYSRNQFPDAWAIAKNNGNYLFPAAYILQEYATGKDNPSLNAAITVTSQSYLVTNTDSQTTINLHISDRLGLILQLDTSKHYTLSLSNTDRVRPIEAFHYEHLSDAYSAVYQAASKGSVTLNIIPGTSSTGGSVSLAPVFTITITIA